MSVSANTSAAPEAHEQTSRTPVLYLLGSGLCWLLVGLVFSALASLKLHAPECLPFAWAGAGRLQAAASNVLLLGAASQTGLGIALWLLIHLGRTELACWGTAVIGTVVWNVALTAGVPALLLGGSTGIPGLELPASLAVILLVGYLLVAGNGIVAIAGCRRGGYAPSQWFILGAILWFGWLYTTAVVTTVVFPGRGVLTALSAGWFNQGFQWLWLTPLALAALYHFIPDLSGTSLRSPELAPVAFWLLALFGGWTAAAGIVGGPIPAWIVSVSVAAGVLLAGPVARHARSFSAPRYSDPCGCNETALRDTLSEAVGGAPIARRDLLHASFSSALYEPAWCVVRDTSGGGEGSGGGGGALVVTCRGSMSLEDLVTDAVAVPLRLGLRRGAGAEAEAEADEERRILLALGFDGGGGGDGTRDGDGGDGDGGCALCVHAGMWRAARLLRDRLLRLGVLQLADRGGSTLPLPLPLDAASARALERPADGAGGLEARMAALGTAKGGAAAAAGAEEEEEEEEEGRRRSRLR